MRPVQRQTTTENTTEIRGGHQRAFDGRGARLARIVAIVSVFFVVGNGYAKGDPGTPTAEHMGLTPSYLAGEWCLTHIQFPKERSEENIRYRFDPDGTFAYQNTSHSTMRPGFFYFYKPEGKIKLHTFAGFSKVTSVKPDAFVLHMFGDLNFRRGPCK